MMAIHSLVTAWTACTNTRAMESVQAACDCSNAMVVGELEVIYAVVSGQIPEVARFFPRQASLPTELERPPTAQAEKVSHAR